MIPTHQLSVSIDNVEYLIDIVIDIKSINIRKSDKNSDKSLSPRDIDVIDYDAICEIDKEQKFTTKEEEKENREKEESLIKEERENKEKEEAKKVSLVLQVQELKSLKANTIVRPRKILYTQGFIDFWKAYPRKVAKVQAWRTWQKHGLDNMTQQILAHTNNFAAYHAINKTEEVHIPYPSTYLNREDFEEKVIYAIPAKASDHHITFKEWADRRGLEIPKDKDAMYVLYEDYCHDTDGGENENLDRAIRG